MFPTEIFLQKNYSKTLQSAGGETFSSKKCFRDHIRAMTGRSDFSTEMIDNYFANTNNAENIGGNVIVVAPFRFCDMAANIVDKKRQKAHKASREFNKRRRRSQARKISGQRSTRCPSISIFCIIVF
jgi:hypothetical protein